MLPTGAGAQQPSRPRTAIIKAARLLDVRSQTYRRNETVLVVDGRIAAIGPLEVVRRKAPSGTAAVDLGPATLLPGLIDAHAHVLASMNPMLDGRTNIIDAVTKTGLDERVRTGEMNARELLDAGFTTVTGRAMAAGVPVAAGSDMCGIRAGRAGRPRSRCFARSHVPECLPGPPFASPRRLLQLSSVGRPCRSTRSRTLRRHHRGRRRSARRHRGVGSCDLRHERRVVVRRPRLP